MAEQIILLGASIRAAAHSVRRAGYAAVGCDLFNDADLLNIADAKRCNDYPQDFLSYLQQSPSQPWMYTGGLEDYPQLISQLASERFLLGNHAEVLRQVRNPFRLSEALRQANLKFPKLLNSSRHLPRNTVWLKKQYCGSGGSGVSLWKNNSTFKNTHKKYLQEKIQGRSASAVYVADDQQATLLGITEQLIAPDWTAASGFQYAGSIGPLQLPADVNQTFVRIGDVLRKAFGLIGLFGVDVIIDRQNQVWTVEVNPRYTASIEVLEQASGFQAISMHVDVCRNRRLKMPVQRQPTCCVGKAILFAKRKAVMEPSIQKWLLQEAGCSDWPTVADIPNVHCVIETTQPLMTIFSKGKNQEEILHQLQDKAAEVYSILGNTLSK